MAENDDHGRIPARRRRDDLSDYGFMSEDDVERFVARAVDARTARFLSDDEIERRIDQRSGQRWRNGGFVVSPNPFEGGQEESDLRSVFDFMRDLHRRKAELEEQLAHLKQLLQRDKDRKAKPFAAVLLAIQLMGGLATFGGVVWAIISFLTGHFAWKA
jgi:hypothetical protein